MRNPISRPCRALIRKLNPGRSALLQRCHSIPFRIRHLAGERIALEFTLSDDLSRRRAAKLARDVAGLRRTLVGVLVASLAVKLSENSIVFDAVVLWP